MTALLFFFTNIFKIVDGPGSQGCALHNGARLSVLHAPLTGGNRTLCTKGVDDFYIHSNNMLLAILAWGGGWGVSLLPFLKDRNDFPITLLLFFDSYR